MHDDIYLEKGLQGRENAKGKHAGKLGPVWRRPVVHIEGSVGYVYGRKVKSC